MSELARFLDRGWTWLEAPGRLGVLATVAARGAEARTVMLRQADRTEGRVVIHTDSQTPKCAEIAAAPGATLLFWDADLSLQIRLRLELRLRPGTDTEWAAVPLASRGNYGTVPAPGRPISGPEAYRRDPDPARLVVVEGRVAEIDLVDLSRPLHRRALFLRVEDWAGRWLAP